MKIYPLRSKVLHADGQTETHNGDHIAFRNFANTPKNWEREDSVEGDDVLNYEIDTLMLG
jgi:hypothetical protein